MPVLLRPISRKSNAKWCVALAEIKEAMNARAWPCLSLVYRKMESSLQMSPEFLEVAESANEKRYRYAIKRC